MTSAIFILICIAQMISPSVLYENIEDNEVKVTNETLNSDGIPRIKMLKRFLRNFKAGQSATLTVVFHAASEVDVRWFKEDTSQSYTNSEIPYMIPLSPDDSEFKTSEIRSGHVVACTVNIPNFDGFFPLQFEIVITFKDGTQQYQLKTHIHHNIVELIEDIDSPEWIDVPETQRDFKIGTELGIHCKVIVPNESRGFTNELVMYRTMPLLKPGVSPRLEFQNVCNIHKDMGILMEENGNVIYYGRRTPLAKHNHVIYEVKVRIQNASATHQGIYQCAIERKQDKAFVLSKTHAVTAQTIFPASPRAELIPCDPKQFNNHKNIIHLSNKERESCIRCRGYGNARPVVVAIYKNNQEIVNNQRINVFKYTNVADGGVSEATYLFRDPASDLDGHYTCVAENNTGKDEVKFQVKYRN